MGGGDEFLRVCARAARESRREGIRGLPEDAAVGGDGAVAALEVSVPDGRCVSFHKSGKGACYPAIRKVEAELALGWSQAAPPPGAAARRAFRILVGPSHGDECLVYALRVTSCVTCAGPHWV